MPSPSATQLALPERTYQGRVSEEELRDRCEDKLKPIRSLAEFYDLRVADSFGYVAYSYRFLGVAVEGEGSRFSTSAKRRIASRMT